MITEPIDFPEKPGYPKSDILRVQHRLLEMADAVVEVLERHSVPYFIAYGTLLGAVRHGGFIPWDDDFDLMMFDDSYDVALDFLRNELPPTMLVHDRKTDPIFWPAWSRVRDLKSSTTASLWPDDNAYKYTGINLDLYRIKRMKRCEVASYRKKEQIEFLVRKHMSGLLSDECYCAAFNKCCLEYATIQGASSEYDGANDDMFAFALPNFVQQRADIILPLKRYTFCGRKFWGPHDAAALLTNIYGNYSLLPEYGKRMSHYDSVKFY